mgnify:CR=1 FL=1
MSNLERYNRIFCEQFSLEKGFDGEKIKMNETEDWDSVGHLDLIAALEDDFEIIFETADILTFDSYLHGIEILGKYGIEIF